MPPAAPEPLVAEPVVPPLPPLPPVAPPAIASALPALPVTALPPVEPEAAWPPEPVALAAYFVACEALANVAKYAQARHAAIRVRCADELLRVDIADDGVGGADETLGSGLRGLADRVEALDGRLKVSSPPGAGTVITAELPCRSTTTG